MKPRCQMCQCTDAPHKVSMYGWSNELTIPTQISLCDRCRDNWTLQTRINYVDVSGATKEEADTILGRLFGRKVDNGN